MNISSDLNRKKNSMLSTLAIRRLTSQFCFEGYDCCVISFNLAILCINNVMIKSNEALGNSIFGPSD